MQRKCGLCGCELDLEESYCPECGTDYEEEVDDEIEIDDI